MSGQFFKSITILGILKILPIFWVVACAWPFGGATWWAQQWINGFGIAALTLTVSLTLFAEKKLTTNRAAVAVLALMSLCGVFAILQSIPLSAETPLFSSLPAIKLQKSYLENSSTSSSMQQGQSPPVEQRPAAKVSISVDRGHTLAAVSNLGLAAIAFAVGFFLIGRSPNLVFATLALIAFNCAAMAAIGIAEDVAASKWQLLSIEKPTAFASFVSRNSAAMFLNVGIACGLGAIGCRQENKSSVTSDPKYRYASTSVVSKITSYIEDIAAEISSIKLAIAAAVVLMFVGVLVTLSRGGMASAIAAFLITAGIALFRVRKIEGALFIAGLLVAAVSLVVWLDQLDPVTNRIETVTEGNAVDTDLRWTVWGFAQKASASLWLTGSGLGNFHYAYLPFQDKPVDTWFYHAESFYWQCLVDLGLVGIVSVIGGIAIGILVIHRLLKITDNKPAQAIAVSLAFLLAAITLHGFVEFSLFLPAIYIPVCVVLGIATAMMELQPSKKRRRTKRRSRIDRVKESQTQQSNSQLLPILCLATSGCLVLVGMYFNKPRSAAESIQSELNRWSFEQENAESSINAIVAKGEKALQQFPNDGQLNLVMGKLYVEQYRWLTYRLAPTGQAAWEATNPQVTRAQYFRRSKQETLTVDSLLADPERSQTLTKALNCYRTAHQTMPLDWRPHLSLAELDFVDFENQHTQLHLEKLETLAFNRAKVLTNAGIVALVYPGKDLAFALFKRAMESSPAQVTVILPISISQFGNRIVEEPFLPQHAPTLLQLANRFSETKADPAITEAVWKQIADALPNMPDSDRQKALIAAQVFRRSGNLKGEIDSLRTAVTMNPLNADIRFQYAKSLFEDKQFVQAREQINTCIRQQPDKKSFVDFRDMLERSLPSLPNVGN